jgi:hypothetical protein
MLRARHQFDVNAEAAVRSFVCRAIRRLLLSSQQTRKLFVSVPKSSVNLAMRLCRAEKFAQQARSFHVGARSRVFFYVEIHVAIPIAATGRLVQVRKFVVEIVFEISRRVGIAGVFGIPLARIIAGLTRASSP